MAPAESVNERDNILNRIREALRAHTIHPAHGTPPPAPHPPARRAAEWLPAVGASFEERLALFRKNSAELKTAFHLLPSREAGAAHLAALAVAQGWKKVARHRGELVDALCRDLPLEMLVTDDNHDHAALETCDAGITECDALIAQTGSILLTSRRAGGRALSVLPPHHVVLARCDQLLPDLPAAFALVKQRYGNAMPGMISLITGPSRTGDIERILVLGAHGPRDLTVLLMP